jgi:vancomycin resistance protein YoaR
MTTIPFLLDPKKNLLQIGASLLAGALLFLLTVAALTGVYQLAYAGKIMPGVRVAGVDLSGLRPEEAATRLGQVLSYPSTGQIVFRDGGQVWVATPAELGMVFDVGASVRSAYGVGRSAGLFGNLSGQVQSWRSGVDVPPVVIVDQRVAYAYLQNIAAQVNRPVIEADLHLNGTEVIYAPGQIGRMVDMNASLASLELQIQAFRDGEVPLVINEQAPHVMDAAAQADALRGILSAPLVLTVPDYQSGDPGPWTVDIPTLAGMVTIGRVPAGSGEQLQVLVNPESLQALLSSIATQMDRGPANARFVFNDSTRQLDLIANATIGRALDVAATLASIQANLLAGQHDIPLTMVYTQPAVADDATAASLGITELVVEQTSYFRGSGQPRMQNIKTAAAKFHGLLIAPGEVFSMAQVLGDISLENGFTEAMIIYNGHTIKGVGGGVCQVSTTLFRTAFFAGFPILERTPHAYRVSYYEQTASGRDNNLAGLDATVYFPLVDLKFTNDTPYWLLMETYVNTSAQRIIWKFYSTKDGRTVDWVTTGPVNIVPAPEPLFQLNPDLSQGEMKQTDWAADGADVTVTRTVTRGGLIISNDTFRTHYLPWQAVCDYGPGTDDWVGLANAEGLCQAP